MPALLPFYAALAGAILCGVAGQVLFKTGATRGAGVLGQFLDPFTVLGLGFYAVAAVFYILAIRRIPVSLAFPTSSLSYIAVALIAHYFWGEPLGLAQLAGILFIILGLVLLHQ